MLIVSIVLSFLLVGCGHKRESIHEASNVKDFNALDFSVSDREAPMQIETYLESDSLHYKYSYDMEYLPTEFFGTSVSNDDLKAAVRNNPNIQEPYLSFILDFIDRITLEYPQADLRVFKKNLETLEIVECPERELVNASISVDSYGCYVQTENRIYILNGPLPEKGTWEYQVLYHELCHACRSFRREIDGWQIVAATGLKCNLLTYDEALNSLFSVSLFDYEERDIAYQLQSNCYAVMVSCMDDIYALDDYINHSQSYFAKKMDEYNGDTNYGYVIMQLMEAQYEDYHSDLINRPPEVYTPIYEYITSMYFKKYMTDDMDYPQARELADELCEKIMFDVPAGYQIDTDVFYQCIERYYQGG